MCLRFWGISAPSRILVVVGILFRDPLHTHTPTPNQSKCSPLLHESARLNYPEMSDQRIISFCCVCTSYFKWNMNRGLGGAIFMNCVMSANRNEILATL